MPRVMRVNTCRNGTYIILPTSCYPPRASHANWAMCRNVRRSRLCRYDVVLQSDAQVAPSRPAASHYRSDAQTGSKKAATDPGFIESHSSGRIVHVRNFISGYAVRELNDTRGSSCYVSHGFLIKKEEASDASPPLLQD